jgi:hypothetical protein
MAAKKFDPKAKAKRQKIMAIGGAVLLIGLLAFQVPRTMALMNRKPPTEAVPVAAAPSSVPSDPSVLPTPGSVGGGGGSSAPAGGSSVGTLISSDPSPVPRTGQLIAFGRFSSKDPFKQQVDVNAAAGPGAGSSSPTSPTSPPTSGGVVPTTPAGSAPSAPAGSAVISVNGVSETVAAKADFPKDSPVFTLVSLRGGVAKIGIAGGALASGAPTLTLQLGKAVTLVNTADGTRYELKLVSLG